MKPMIATLLIGLIFIIGCSTEPETGFIAVSVLNAGTEQPVEDVKITVRPGELVRQTNKKGKALFDVEPGDYFVDANVCCIGPGFIDYHVPVTVIVNETTEVKLIACLDCV